MERIFTVEFLPSGKKTKTSSKTTIMDVAHASGFEFQGECDGKGTCGKCMVRLIKSYTEPTGNEGHLFSGGKLAEGFRLACQALVESDLKVFLPEESFKQIDKTR
jgi:uncharacterized 2Fe-2S/4Fe-4S cluster protein (DUF4445 family)